jgi:hypothetical protein
MALQTVRSALWERVQRRAFSLKKFSWKSLEPFPYLMVGMNLSNSPTSAMNRLASLVLFFAAVAFILCVEYEMAMWLGIGLLLVVTCGLAVIGFALVCAPLGCDRQSGFHVCRPRPIATHIPYHRFSQSVRVRL